ncbi:MULTISPECIES: DUF6732 family protein [Roseovarius]|uniref:DUF6732 family protein n=2 Tax=Roseovarius TaxID=74030 RepID=A0ABZ2HM91_9RHOB|nr:DUF6732 family protein [Roseovarius sp. W115]MDV2929391.1 DUF6732 family protein [Roseovarius sp. W115]
MHRLFALLTLLLPGAALAHPGHLAEVAGHGHWLSAGALAAAAALGLWAAKGRKSKENAENTSDAPLEDDEPQEA